MFVMTIIRKKKNYLMLEDELIADETIDVHETIIKNMTSTQLQEVIYELNQLCKILLF